MFDKSSTLSSMILIDLNEWESCDSHKIILQKYIFQLGLHSYLPESFKKLWLIFCNQRWYHTPGPLPGSDKNEQMQAENKPFQVIQQQVEVGN